MATDEDVLSALDALPPDRTCTLDIAETGGVTLEQIGELWGTTREAVRQVEAAALARVRESLGAEWAERDSRPDVSLPLALEANAVESETQ